jgi:hypothetical protein
MAYVNADNQSRLHSGWKTDDLQFEIVNIDGAVEALTNGTADYFMGNVL